MKIGKSACAVLAVAALSLGLAGDLHAEPTQCTPYGRGGTTGDPYELEGQELVTVTTTTIRRTGGSLLWGAITLSGGEETITETAVTFYQGTYRNTRTGTTMTVNCSTGSRI